LSEELGSINRTQRNRNRANARELEYLARQRVLMAHTCENCGEKGGHWVSMRGISLQAALTGQDDSEGFWTCPKLYGPDGRRLPEHTDARMTGDGGLAALVALLPNGSVEPGA
jgi:hypothetical protein